MIFLIALVRHGQTEENFLGKIQGQSNHLLNDTGRRQCQRLKDKIREKHFDYCFTSPLIRCFETAMILIGDKVEIISDSRIVERNMGELEGKEYSLYNKFEYWDYDLNKSDLGVEPIQDVFRRCEDFLNYIMTKYPNKDILIVTHGAPYRALRYLLRKKKLKGKMMDQSIENCQYEEFENL